MLPKSKLYAFALLAAVAVAGFAAGAASRVFAEGGRAMSEGDLRERCSYSGRLARQLDLTPAQADSVRAVMRRHQPAMRALLEPMRPRMDSMRVAMRAEIRAQLDARQAAVYDSLVQARDRAERARTDSAAAAPGTR